MSRRKFITSPLFYLTSLTTLTPLAAVVAASCSEDEVSSLRTKLAAEAASIYVDPVSLSNDLKWIYGRHSAAFSQFSGIASFLYLSGYYPDLAAAKAAPLSAWSLVPPKNADDDHSRRFLWLKITFRNGDVGDDDFHYFDITKTSGIQSVITAISNFSYEGNVLEKIVFNKVNDQFVIDESAVNLPPGTKIVYSVSNSPWVDRELVQSYVNKQGNHRYEVIFGVRAKLVSLDIQKFSVVTNGFLTRVIPNIIWNANVDPDFLALFSQIKASFNREIGLVEYRSGTATPTSIFYSLPSYVARVRYRIDVAKTPAQLLDLDADKWTTFIPWTTTISPVENIHLYVKLDPQFNAILDQRIIDITESSGVREAFRDSAASPKIRN